MRQLWTFLKKRPNREVLGWLGGGLAVVVGAIWVVFDNLDPPAPDSRPAVKAFDGSVAAGGDIVGSTITIERPSDIMTPRSLSENGNASAEE